MYESMSSLNFLGMNELMSTNRFALGQSNGEEDKSGNQVFADLLSRLSDPDQQGGMNGIMNTSGTGTLGGQSLQQLFLKAMLQTIGNDYLAVDTATPTTTTANTDTTGTPASTAVAQSTTDTNTTPEVSTPKVPTRSQRDIVFTVGSENAELMSRINDATSLDDRLQAGTEMRDKIVTALRNEGYTVENTSSIDKISINGQVIDVLQNLKTLGMNSSIQYLDVLSGSTPNSGNNTVTSAILEAAQGGIDLLMQLRSSTDPSERQKLALMIRTNMIEQLNAKGYTTTAVYGSADKITVNGSTYDFLGGLNSNGSQTSFQALKV